jgi:hypothetical protein
MDYRAKNLLSSMEIKRWPDVEAEIQRVLGLHQAQWLTEVPDLHSETLVYLARHTGPARPEVFGPLLRETSRRVMGQANNSIYGLKETEREFIVLQVEMAVTKLILTDKPTRRSGYLESAFAKAVNQLVVDYVRIYKHSAMGHCDEIVTRRVDEEDSAIQEPADDRPGPQAVLLQNEGEAIQAELVQKAYRAVKDPLDRKLIRLHLGKGQTTRELERPNLTGRQIKHRIARALKAMRNVLGVSK